MRSGTVAAETPDPQGDLGDVLDPPGRDPGEVHLDHRLLDAGLAPAVALDGRRREARALELGHVDGHLAGARGRAPVAMAGAVRLPLGGAPVAPGPDELVGLRLERAVQRVLDGLSGQLAKIGPKALLVRCCDGFGHGRTPIRFVSRQLGSYRGGPCPPFHLDAIPLSKCAKYCTSPLFDALQFMFKRTGYRFDLRDLCPVREGVRLNIEPDRRTELAQWFLVLHPDHSTGLAIP